MTTLPIYDAEKILRAAQDPLSSVNDRKYLKVKAVHAVFDPDPDGSREVLFTDFEDQPLTAYLGADNKVFSIGVGW